MRSNLQSNKLIRVDWRNHVRNDVLWRQHDSSELCCTRMPLLHCLENLAEAVRPVWWDVTCLRCVCKNKEFAFSALAIWESGTLSLRGTLMHRHLHTHTESYYTLWHTQWPIAEDTLNPRSFYINTGAHLAQTARWLCRTTKRHVLFLYFSVI